MYSLDKIFSGTTYNDSVFSQENINAIQSAIFTKQVKGVDVPFIKCLIRDKEIRLTPEETVRQLFIYKLIHEYNYPRENIKLEYAIHFGIEIKRADIVIFDSEHPESEYIIVEVKKPKLLEGKSQLKSYCNATGALIGVWTNGQQIESYLRKNKDDDGNEKNLFESIRDSIIPQAGQKLRDLLNKPKYISDLAANDKLAANKRSLKSLIQEMEDEVLANAGVDAFEEVFKLIYTKLYDELQSTRNTKRALEFMNYGDTDNALKKNIQALFDSAQSKWPGVFPKDEKISLTPSHLSVCVSSLQNVKLFNSNLDVVDDAFEYLMNKSQKGEKGQFFTPRYVIDMCVKMLNPSESESMIDTAAGSCGFPVHTMFYVWRKIYEKNGIPPSNLFTAEKKLPECEDYVREKVFAIDFDEKAVRVARTLNLIAGDGRTNVLHLNTLDYMHWDDFTKTLAWQKIYFEGWLRFIDFAETEEGRKNFNFDIVMANPPFAGDIQQKNIIANYELGKNSNGKYQSKVGRDILFIERNLSFLKPGGRMAIILPQGRFNNSSDKYIRDFIAERCRILAVVGLHGNVFKPHTGTKTSVLFVQKWDDDLCPRRDDYPIFFAAMQKPSKDNSGDKIYVKDENGSFILDDHNHLIVDHDLFNHDGKTQDGIAEAFIEFAKRENLSFFVDAHSSFNEAKYNALMSGLECCEVMLNVMLSSGRLDAEYYSKYNIFLQNKLNEIGAKTIADYGGRLDCSAFYPSVAEYYDNDRSNIPFLRVNEINNGLINITDATVFLPMKILQENSSTIALAYPGDIVIAKGGTVAKVGLVTNEFSIYATSRDVIILRTNNLEGLNKYFLWAFLHSSYGRGILLRSASQTVQPHLTLPAILNIRIPDITEIQSAIEKLYTKSVKSKLEAESLYHQAQKLLQDELNFSLPTQSHNITTKLFSLASSAARLDAEYFMPKYEYIENSLRNYDPNIKTLSDIAEYIFTGEYAEEYFTLEDNPGFIYYVRGTDIQNGRIQKDNSHYVDPQKFSKFIVTNDIVTGRVGTIGNFGVVDDSLNGALCSDNIICFHLPPEYLPDVYALYFNLPIISDFIRRLSRGSVQQRMNQETLRDVLIPFIKIDTQQKISDLVQKSFTLRRESEQLINLAVKSVEIAIESSEADAVKYINHVILC